MIPTARRNAESCAVRRQVTEDELRKIAGKIASRLVRDAEYRKDLTQDGVVEAIRYQGTDPNAPTGILCKVIFRRMLRQMRHDATNKRQPNFRPAPTFIADLWPHDEFEPPTEDKEYARVDAACLLQVVIGGLSPAEAELVVTMRDHDCGVSDAARIMGVPITTAHSRWEKARDRVLRTFPEGVAA